MWISSPKNDSACIFNADMFLKATNDIEITEILSFSVFHTWLLKYFFRNDFSKIFFFNYMFWGSMDPKFRK